MALFKKLLLLSVLNTGYYFQSKPAAIIQNLSTAKTSHCENKDRTLSSKWRWPYYWIYAVGGGKTFEHMTCVANVVIDIRIFENCDDINVMKCYYSGRRRRWLLIAELSTPN
ncbi:hypothetical protein CDAR_227661 [Caerostris darwini]|uniref:Secreted protein n=1 Tax=Caerostris darwini TaxID=1538125 RepID=A0AAV4VIP2_9ARAC|nr:hypothetical protein CDAR_227661 [Caerostris darwini]